MDIQSGKKSADNLAVEAMEPWVTAKYKNAVQWESEDGVRLWVLPEDGTVVADKNGWVE